MDMNIDMKNFLIPENFDIDSVVKEVTEVNMNMNMNIGNFEDGET